MKRWDLVTEPTYMYEFYKLELKELRQFRAVRALKELIRINKPDIIFFL